MAGCEIIQVRRDCLKIELKASTNQSLGMSIYSKITNTRRYLMVGVVSLLVSIPLYYEYSTILTTYGNTKSLLEHLFQKNDMSKIADELVLYFLYKFLATALSVTLPLPVGLFTPVFLAGGVMGRIIGKFSL